MKYFFAIFLILVLAAQLEATGTCTSSTCAGTSPFTAADATFATVDHCVNTCAAMGETVYVPADSKTWTSNLVITKKLHLVGAGIGLTNITGDGTADLINWWPSNPESDDSTVHYELSGFTFAGQATPASAHACLSVNGLGSGAQIAYGFSVHDNRFINCNKGISGTGVEYGVWWRNQFENNASHIYFGNGGASMYGNTLALGGSTYPVFENNAFGDLSGNALLTETGLAGRLVFRFNTTTNYGAATADVHDQHGYPANYNPVDTGYAGTKSAEIYNNSYAILQPARWMLDRGGKLRMFNNALTGFAASIQLREYSYYLGIAPNLVTDGGSLYKAKQNHTSAAGNEPGTGGGTAYWDVQSPSAYNNGTVYNVGDVVSSGGSFYIHTMSGMGEAGHAPGTSSWQELGAWSAASRDYYQYPAYEQINDSFVFNNLSLGSNVAVTYADPGGATQTYILSNQDYWAQGVAGSVLTSGTGAPVGACTSGYYYGRTDTGQIYKCTASTWGVDYTPYTCPHPLTGLSGSCNFALAGTAGYPTGGTTPATRVGAKCVGCK